jgi:glycosyltransferase involved in cell wall biosynthesis
MRYMWDLFDDYFGEGRASPPVRAAAHALRPWLQRWDRRTAQRVDRFVANSHNVARKIARFYGREALVIHPPVALERFTAQPVEGSGTGGYFLWVGAFAPYKRLDLVLEAFGALGLPLWVAGSGQEAARLGALPPNVRMLGQVRDDALPGLYRDARALIFPGEEDFGITPVEAQASGRPVIALGRGGALETVTPQTGLFFAEQRVDALVQAVRRFEAFEPTFDPRAARANAERFSKDRFQAQLRQAIDRL